MNEKDFADMIRIARRAPLQNMDEAEAVGRLLQRFAQHAAYFLEEKREQKKSKKKTKKKAKTRKPGNGKDQQELPTG